VKAHSVRCGIADCDWGRSIGPIPFTEQVVSDCYALFWDHLVESHGLNPDKGDLPGISGAAYHIDLTRGTFTVNMNAKT
jgi:hypothetical protein